MRKTKIPDSVLQTGSGILFSVFSVCPLRQELTDGIMRAAMTTRKSAKTTKPRRTTTSPEYRAYEKRYLELGEDRPKLSPEEFDALDDELLELLALDDDDMTDEQIVRIQELEYLLIDAE